MAASAKQMEVIEIDDFSPSPNDKTTPLRPVFCLRNKAQMRTIEEQEECFILEFDPDDDLDISGLCFSNDSGKSEVDLRVVAEKGQVSSPLQFMFVVLFTFLHLQCVSGILT